MARVECQKKWANKTKPLRSLGKLEDIVEWIASACADSELRHDAFHLCVYAGSHGVTAEGVSAFPSEVNAQMVQNFRAGGAGINAICAAYGIRIHIVDTGIDNPTGNIAREEAMDVGGFVSAFNLGWNSVPADATLFAMGEMGIGNTTVATALISALLKEDVMPLTGLGTGIDATAHARKVEAIRRALVLHQASHANPWELMRCMGGRELTAMTAALLRATSLRIPVILDGVIATASAAIAFEIQPKCVPFCMAGHKSVEPAHKRILEVYGLEPLLDMHMRLGEGTGAALAMGVVRGALQAYRMMATFDSAGVSSGK